MVLLTLVELWDPSQNQTNREEKERDDESSISLEVTEDPRGVVWCGVVYTETTKKIHPFLLASPAVILQVSRSR